jgi:hypothetical protein
LNHLGLFYPAFSESSISNFTKLVAVTNTSAPLTDRARSYIDANCAQCHRPGGARGNFDARWDTPLIDQNIINGPVIADLGIDNARVVVPQDIWRSVLFQRVDTFDAAIKMPPLARNLIDADAVATLLAWIDSLPGTPALAPPTVAPAGGSFNGSVLVTLEHADSAATLRYTLDGSLPTTDSIRYLAPFTLTSNATVKARASRAGFNDSVAASATFAINALPLVNLLDPTNGTEFVAPTNITLNAVASDSDGNIGKVEFFQGTTKLGERLAQPYTLAWLDAPAGNYTLYALATDNLRATNTSVPVHVTIHAPRISVSLSGDQITLEWANSSAIYVLEYTDSFAPPVTWKQAPEPTMIVDGHVKVTITLGPGHRFYRLRPAL